MDLFIIWLVEEIAPTTSSKLLNLLIYIILKIYKTTDGIYRASDLDLQLTLGSYNSHMMRQVKEMEWLIVETSEGRSKTIYKFSQKTLDKIMELQRKEIITGVHHV